MVIVIAMAGEGRRFRERGITQPKYEVIARGRPLFDWALESVQPWFEAATFRFIARRGAEPFIRARCEALGIARVEVVELDAPTDGQATTVLHGTATCAEDAPLLIYNIDTHQRPGAVTPRDIHPTHDGWVALFRAPGTHWSFAALDGTGRVTAVSEKVRISEFASTGMYYFRSRALFASAYASHAAAVKEQYREVYVMPLYAALLAQGCHVGAAVIPSDAVIPFGTPDEVLQFDAAFAAMFAQ